MTAAVREELASKKGLAGDVEQWNVAYIDDPSLAAEYLNAEPAAGPREAMMALRPDGSIIVWQLF